MRTHLLRTFYPSPAAEPDTGHAANDAGYEQPGTTTSVKIHKLASATSREADRTADDDAYVLGGYAGI